MALTTDGSSVTSLDCEYVLVRLLLVLFKVVGLAPFSVRRSIGWRTSKGDSHRDSPGVRFSTSKFGCVYNLCLVIGNLLHIGFIVPDAYNRDFSSHSSDFRKIEVMACALGNLAVLTVWLHLGIRQKTAVDLLNRLLTPDVGVIRLGGGQIVVSSRTFLLSVCGTGLAVFLTLIIIMQAFDVSRISTYSIFVLPCFICFWFFVQYSYVVKLAENRFKAINESLLECYVGSGWELRELAVELIGTLTPRPKIDKLRGAYAELCELATELSDFCSVPTLFGIVFYCYLLIYISFILVVICLIATELYANTTISLGILYVSNIVIAVNLLAVGVTHLGRETKRTGDIVQKLLTLSNNSYVDHLELKQFLMELLHQRVHFTALGLFPLDCTLIHSIFGMVVTYLIILLQLRLAGSVKIVDSRPPDNVEHRS